MPAADEAGSSEIELKFEIPAAAVPQLENHPAFAGPAEVVRLRSVYFDTPGHDLRNAGVSLRVREAEGRVVQTVKARTGSGGIRRGEWEASLSAPRPDVEALAHTPAAEVLNGHAAADLTPVFATTVERALRLWREAGSLVELSLDQGEIDAGPEREPIHELELELKSGRPQALFSLARDLARTVPIRLSFDSKAERGYRLAGHEGAAAFKAESLALSAETATAEAFRRVARGCLAQISGSAEFLRRVRAPESLHQTRVGLRHLGAALAAFRPVVEDAAFARLRAEAKWLAGELDQARDLDVFIADCVEPDEVGRPGDPGLAAFRSRLSAAQARAYDRASAAVDSRRFADFLLEAAAWVELGAWTSDPRPGGWPGDEPVAGFGAASLQRLHRRVRRAARRFGDLDPEGRHRLRIKAKKLRYAAEFFGPAFQEHPKRRWRYTAALRAVQESLGTLNDVAVAGEVALKAVGARGAETAFAAGLVVGRRRQDEPALIAAAERALDRFARAKRVWPTPPR
jgi:inorganic triphosphatase YgiF